MRTTTVAVAAVVNSPVAPSDKTVPLCMPIANADRPMRTPTMPLDDRPPSATQRVRKQACMTASTPRATVSLLGHTPEPLVGLTIQVDRKTPAAKRASATPRLTTLCPPAPAAWSPRNTKFPVMKAVKIFPRAR